MLADSAVQCSKKLPKINGIQRQDQVPGETKKAMATHERRPRCEKYNRRGNAIARKQMVDVPNRRPQTNPEEFVLVRRNQWTKSWSLFISKDAKRLWGLKIFHSKYLIFYESTTAQNNIKYGLLDWRDHQMMKSRVGRNGTGSDWRSCSVIRECGHLVGWWSWNWSCFSEVT